MHPSTITRELKRNSSQRGVYKWDWAQKHADKRSRRQPGNRAIGKAVWDEVRRHLVNDQWSPEQISGYLARDGIKISHETIYKWIRQDKRDRGTLYKHLRHRLKHRSRPVGASRTNIPGRVSIHERPTEADGRRFGDLEMDTIVGPNNQQAIVTIIERSTNRLFMEKLKHGKDAGHLAQTVIGMLEPFKDCILSITTDNGTEFMCHQMITEALGAQVYFADPYSSWQKGAIENANGLIRQYIPKAMPFSELDDEDIGRITDKINARPRKNSDSKPQLPVLKKKSTGLIQISNKNRNFANKTEKNMRKDNYERLRDAYQQYNDAETAYMRACGCDDDTDRWEKGHYLHVCTDLLTIVVKEILEDEEDFIQYNKIAVAS